MISVRFPATWCCIVEVSTPKQSLLHFLSPLWLKVVQARSSSLQLFLLLVLFVLGFWTKRTYFSLRAPLMQFDMWASLPDSKLSLKKKTKGENIANMTQNDIHYLVVNSSISTNTSSSFKISVFCLHLRSAAINVLWHCRICRTAL